MRIIRGFFVLGYNTFKRLTMNRKTHHTVCSVYFRVSFKLLPLRRNTANRSTPLNIPTSPSIKSCHAVVCGQPLSDLLSCLAFPMLTLRAEYIFTLQFKLFPANSNSICCIIYAEPSDKLTVLQRLILDWSDYAKLLQI